MHSFSEGVVANEVMQHADNGGSLGVRNGVEYLFYLAGVPNRNLLYKVLRWRCRGQVTAHSNNRSIQGTLVNRNTDKGISVKEYKVNSPSLYKCMQVTPVNTNSG